MPILLDPLAVTDPRETTSQHLAQRKGLPVSQVQQTMSYVTQMAKQVGLDYHIDRAIVVTLVKL